MTRLSRAALASRTNNRSDARPYALIFGNIAYGYQLAVDGVHLEPDPSEQAALSRIRDMRRGGHTLRGIAAALNRQGYRTRRGSEWRLESVVRALKRDTLDRTGR